MKDQKQVVTMTIYPAFEEPREWRFDGYVYGEWVAHKAHKDDAFLQDRGFTWAVSHIPTGAIAYVAKKKNVVQEAARRLSQIEPPKVQVLAEDGQEPRMSPPPSKWIRRSNERLADLDIVACVGGRLIAPRDVYRDYLAAMKRKEKSVVNAQA